MQQGHYGKAADHLHASLALAEELKNWSSISAVHEDLAKLDSIQGNFQGAYEHYKLHIAARDSFEKAENRSKITELRMQYDFDKKEAENKGEVNGFKGTVVEINIHETVLSSVDGKQRITIPNTLVSTVIIIHHEPA